MIEIVGWVALVAALVPAALFFRNCFLFRTPEEGSSQSPISVLIPARNEEGSIADAVRSVLASRGVEVEVVVLDDHSTDRTAEVVRGLASGDNRVKLLAAPPLPKGWCGKQHACFVLSKHARYPLLCFLDADVRVAPVALARASSLLAQGQYGLVSGFPRQLTESTLERLLIPLIHFVLLSYLPFDFMRLFNSPAFAAGCGQFMLVTREAYEKAGGHAAIRESMHDGLRLPKQVRSAGFRTDCFDASKLAVCRMYRTAAEVWAGLGKNAAEGMAAPSRILPFTFLLFMGQVLPLLLLVVSSGNLARLAAVALLSTCLVRIVAAARFQQSVGSALLHPIGVMVLLVLQWQAFYRSALHRPSSWKGRDYAPVPLRDHRTGNLSP